MRLEWFHLRAPDGDEGVEGSPRDSRDPVLDTALDEFRRSVRERSRRPEAFWLEQRESVMAHLQATPRRQVAMAWAAAAIVTVVLLTVFADRPRAVPPPDFAAGYDQELLLDVDRAVSREAPRALDPGMVLVREIERKDGNGL